MGKIVDKLNENFRNASGFDIARLRPGMSSKEGIEAAEHHIRWFDGWALETKRNMESKLKAAKRKLGLEGD